MTFRCAECGRSVVDDGKTIPTCACGEQYFGPGIRVLAVTLGTRTHRIEVYRTHVSAAPPALAELRMLPWHEARQRIEDMGATWEEET